LSAAYGTGRGRVTVQARAHIEEMGRGRSRIIVTELPYQTNKSTLIERIAELSRGGDLDGLSDLRDESDRQGMRIVIELARTADPAKVLSTLYQRTPMQTTFGISMLALVDDEPRTLSLKQALRVYLDHRLEVTRRRSQYELERAQERAHILAGLRLALQHLDEVIQLIRAAHDVDQARQRLMKRFKLSDLQARSILDMPLRRLAALERKKIEQDYKETLARIDELESLLSSEKKMRSYIADELRKLKADFGDRRRTQIVDAARAKRSAGALTAGDVLEEKETWVAVTPGGLISRTPTARLPRLSGRDAPSILLSAQTSDALYLFASDGRCAAVPVHRLPESDDPARGTAAGGATPLPPGVRPVAGLILPAEAARSGDGTILLGTHQGIVKRIPLEALPAPSGRTFSVIALGAGDQLGWVCLTGGTDDILLASSSGMVIRFPEHEVRAVGLAAAGVMGMRLERKERLVAVDVARREGDLLVVAENGFAKRVPLAQFPTQGRNGKGLRVYKSGVALAGGRVGSEEDHAFVHLARGGARSIKFAAVPRRSRAANGARLIETGAKDRVQLVGSAQSRPAVHVAAPPKAAVKAKKKKEPRKSIRPRKAGAKSRGPSVTKGKTAAKKPSKPKSKKGVAGPRAKAKKKK
jgi:DNA gyrase subunit A